MITAYNVKLLIFNINYEVKATRLNTDFTCHPKILVRPLTVIPEKLCHMLQNKNEHTIPLLIFIFIKIE